MIPVTPLDMAARPWIGVDAWPIKPDDLTAYFGEVATVLNLPNAAGAEDNGDESMVSQRFPELSQLGPDFSVRLSTWLPFKARNFAQAFTDALRNDHDLSVWLNARVTSLDTSSEHGHCRLWSVSARNAAGNTLAVHAKHFVLCAGALETTRLLLEHDERTNGSITRFGAPLGCYLSDHLSVTCARFKRHRQAAFNSAVSPIFKRGLMRTPRLELSAAAQRRHQLPSAFAHVTFQTDGATGFDVVRNFLRRQQGEQQPLGLSARGVGRIVHDVALMAYWRFLHTRLWIPAQASVLLQIDLEQIPNKNSRLFLSDERDMHGRKRLAVDWRVTDEDIAAIRTILALVAERWQTAPLATMASLELTADRIFDSFETLYDVYHPTGTIRMGRTPADSVVDRDLRLWAMENCYVSTTAVFPSAGSANPGFTHLALTARLADHLANSIHQERVARIA
jgi:choline dehydrogenase-like flavoprotein